MEAGATLNNLAELCGAILARFAWGSLGLAILYMTVKPSESIKKGRIWVISLKLGDLPVFGVGIGVVSPIKSL